LVEPNCGGGALEQAFHVGSADATARRRDEFHAVDEYGADAFVLERGLGVGDGRECPGVDLDPSAVLLCVGVAEVEGGLNDRLIALADFVPKRSA
jgi:hypothetical protein